MIVELEVEAAGVQLDDPRLGLPEAALMAAIVELAGWRGWRWYHTHDSRRSPEGFPDLMLVRGPRLVFAELKATNGRLTKRQRAWLDNLETLEAAGACEVYLWRPVHWLSGAIEEVLE